MPERGVPQDLDVEGGEQFGLDPFGELVQAAGQFGQFVQQGEVVAVLAGVLLQCGQLGGDGFPLGMQGDELLADAGAVGIGGFGGHVGGVVQFSDEVPFGHVGLLELEAERVGLGAGPGLGVGRPGREEFGEVFGAAGGQRVPGQVIAESVEQQVLAGGDGAGVIGAGGGVTRVAGIELADVVGVIAVGAAFTVGAGDAAHAPLA